MIVFALVRVVPGDPARLVAGLEATEEEVEQIRHQLGLDKPLHVQYTIYLGGLLKGDFGKSIYARTPVIDEIAPRLSATLQLSAYAMLWAVGLGLLLGIIAAATYNSLLDNLASVVAVLTMSTPYFFLGLMLILFFSQRLGWLPTLGSPDPKGLILPAITLGSSTAAMVARMARANLLEVLEQDYIRTARSKGLTEIAILLVHALRNALIPVVTLIGIRFGTVLGGAVVTESVFGYPGLGRLLVGAIKSRDFPIVQGSILVIAGCFVLINLIVDFTYGFLDPRIGYE